MYLIKRREGDKMKITTGVSKTRESSPIGPEEGDSVFI
ncbi:hypothetical protein HASA104033_11470 [Halobacterium salinarum]